MIYKRYKKEKNPVVSLIFFFKFLIFPCLKISSSFLVLSLSFFVCVCVCVVFIVDVRCQHSRAST